MLEACFHRAAFEKDQRHHNHREAFEKNQHHDVSGHRDGEGWLGGGSACFLSERVTKVALGQVEYVMTVNRRWVESAEVIARRM